MTVRLPGPAARLVPQSPATSVPSRPASAVPAVRAAEMAQVDRLAVERFGISLLQMMENASAHLAEVVRLELGGDLVGRRVTVIAGLGNNGAGGMAAARHLANRGAIVRVALAQPALRVTESGRHQLATLLAMGVPTCVAEFDFAPGELEGTLAESDVIVDALLGYNATGASHGGVANVIRLVGAAHRPVVSLDLPSGIDPDTGEAAGDAITAQATLTLALPKRGLFAVRGRASAGRIYVGDLGLPADLFRSLGIEVPTLFERGSIVLLDFAS